MYIYDFFVSIHISPNERVKKNHFVVFLQKKISIGILLCDVMLFTNANHVFSVTSGHHEYCHVK